MLPFARLQITALQPAVSGCKQARWPPWLWCNLLSLDAPLVAVLWQILFARCFRVHLGLAIPATLGLAVWFIYAADRMLDALHLDASLIPPARHAFCREHWNGMAVALMAGLFTLGGLCGHVPVPVLRNGVILVLAIALYFGIVHRRPLQIQRFWPKEIVVGCIFGAGTCLAVWTMSGPAVQSELILPGGLFGALCVLNCAAIEYWEWNGCSSQWSESPHPATIWIGRHFGGLSLTVAAASALALGVCRPSKNILFLALLLSSLSLWLLARHSRHLTISARRVLADAALLTPLVGLAVS